MSHPSVFLGRTVELEITERVIWEKDMFEEELETEINVFGGFLNVMFETKIPVLPETASILLTREIDELTANRSQASWPFPLITPDPVDEYILAPVTPLSENTVVLPAQYEVSEATFNIPSI